MSEKLPIRVTAMGAFESLTNTHIPFPRHSRCVSDPPSRGYLADPIRPVKANIYGGFLKAIIIFLAVFGSEQNYVALFGIVSRRFHVIMVGELNTFSPQSH